MRTAIAALSARLRLVDVGENAGDADRASGDVVCGCGLVYYDHPEDPVYPFLNVRCDGSKVKL